jgi:Zn ribbon nucleic-acid-binding protein
MRFACPPCGATRELRGEREGAVVHLSCGSCGHEWTHDPYPCPTCGGRVGDVRKPLLRKARGTQQSIIGYRTEKESPRCDREQRRDGSMSAT